MFLLSIVKTYIGEGCVRHSLLSHMHPPGKALLALEEKGRRLFQTTADFIGNCVVSPFVLCWDFFFFF